MIKAVIFDMDGLLIDSEPLWRKSHRQVLAGYGHSVSEDDVRAMAGRRTAEVADNWRQRFEMAQPNTEALTQEIVDTVVAEISKSGTALPGVGRLVDELARHKVPMAVASSSSTKMIDAVLDRLQLRKYMQAVHSGEHEERGKPFPDVFLTTAKSLGVAAADCVVFEDSINGVLAAKAAGMLCVAVPEEPYNPIDFSSADLVVASLVLVRWSTLLQLDKNK